MCWRSLAASLLILLNAAACTPLPQPFAHTKAEVQKSKKVLELPDGAGIVVNPNIEGAPPEISVALANAMVKALSEANIPASTTGGNKSSQVLEGRLAAAPVAGRNKVLILWTLSDHEGNKIGEYLQHETVDLRGWQTAQPAVMTGLATKAAEPIAGLIQDKGAVNTPGQGSIAEVRMVEGAPGDGATSLTRAMRFYLQQAKVKIVDKPTPEALIVQGTVEISAPRGGAQPITITWRVLGPDGSEMGKVAQNNAVPTGSLDKTWGDIAFLIAEAAAPGVTQIIKRVADTPGQSR
ncbi:MAG: hypothetical protein NTY59_17215 [Alphaproteobacteria bacterium]|nr:hypothetical protein [Alphaproteobacteria bacterium]